MVKAQRFRDLGTDRRDEAGLDRVRPVGEGLGRGDRVGAGRGEVRRGVDDAVTVHIHLDPARLVDRQVEGREGFPGDVVGVGPAGVAGVLQIDDDLGRGHVEREGRLVVLAAVERVAGEVGEAVGPVDRQLVEVVAQAAREPQGCRLGDGVEVDGGDRAGEVAVLAVAEGPVATAGDQAIERRVRHPRRVHASGLGEADEDAVRLDGHLRDRRIGVVDDEGRGVVVAGDPVGVAVERAPGQVAEPRSARADGELIPPFGENRRLGEAAVPHERLAVIEEPDLARAQRCGIGGGGLPEDRAGVGPPDRQGDLAARPVLDGEVVARVIRPAEVRRGVAGQNLDVRSVFAVPEQRIHLVLRQPGRVRHPQQLEAGLAEVAAHGLVRLLPAQVVIGVGLARRGVGLEAEDQADEVVVAAVLLDADSTGEGAVDEVEVADEEGREAVVVLLDTGAAVLDPPVARREVAVVSLGPGREADRLVGGDAQADRRGTVRVGGQENHRQRRLPRPGGRRPPGSAR